MRALVSAVILGAVLGGCGRETQRADLVPSRTGQIAVMLRNAGQLTPGGPDQAALRYIAPNVNWNKYTKLIIQPVTFWGGAPSAADAATQQMLCDYLYNALVAALSKDLRLVTAPGPNTAVLRVALTDVAAADPGLRTISVVVPQARLLSVLGSAATGGQVFAGSAQAEGEVTDSLTGQRLAAFIDRREGGSAVTTAAGGRWSDVKAIMDTWAAQIARRYETLRLTAAAGSASR